ncbi:membrane protein [Salmonella enterica subsp. enterica serovar Typhimurium]|nr:membrane protein [Salmonella enterica subsp. enterica serovar Typhimurium]
MENLSPCLRWDSHSFYLVVITSQINTLVEEMKEQQKEQETKINLLEKQQKEQEAKINLLENNKLRLSTQPKRSPKSLAALNAKQRLFDYTELDPSQTHYFIINNGNIGLAGRILSIEPIDNGSVIHLDLVNLLSIPVSNLAFNMTWGTKKPSEAKDLPRWKQLLLNTKMDSTIELLPGAWTNVTLTLKGVSPNNLKYLKIGIDMENVIFDSIQPINDTKKKPKK